MRRPSHYDILENNNGKWKRWVTEIQRSKSRYCCSSIWIHTLFLQQNSIVSKIFLLTQPNYKKWKLKISWNSGNNEELLRYYIVMLSSSIWILYWIPVTNSWIIDIRLNMFFYFINITYYIEVMLIYKVMFYG